MAVCIFTAFKKASACYNGVWNKNGSGKPRCFAFKLKCSKISGGFEISHICFLSKMATAYLAQNGVDN